MLDYVLQVAVRDTITLNDLEFAKRVAQKQIENSMGKLSNLDWAIYTGLSYGRKEPSNHGYRVVVTRSRATSDPNASLRKNRISELRI